MQCAKKAETLAALECYRKWHWRVIPFKKKSKVPAVRWKPYQTRAPSDKTYKRWFKNGASVGIILGEASGGLLARDFDDEEIYRQWCDEHPELAKLLPTVKTARGFHVYCRDVEGRTNPRPNLPGGEMRGDGHCIVASPSIHESGAAYSWLIEPNGAIPAVDVEKVFGAKFPKARKSLTKAGTAPPTQAIQKQINLHPEVLRQVKRAIRLTQPQKVGERNKRLMALCRMLKKIPEIADLETEQMKEIVKAWWEMASDVIGTPEPHYTLGEFAGLWPKTTGGVSFPDVFERAKQAERPEYTKGFKSKTTVLLVKICREMAIENGGPDEIFFLSGKDAATGIGCEQSHAAKLLRGLCVDGILNCTRKGELKGGASEYFIIPEMKNRAETLQKALPVVSVRSVRPVLSSNNPVAGEKEIAGVSKTKPTISQLYNRLIEIVSGLKTLTDVRNVVREVAKAKRAYGFKPDEEADTATLKKAIDEDWIHKKTALILTEPLYEQQPR